MGPVVGEEPADYASWRWIFYVNVPLGAVAMFVVGTYLHESVERRLHNIDYAGAVLLPTAIGLLMIGLLEGGTGWAWLSAPSLLAFVASAVALGSLLMGVGLGFLSTSLIVGLQAVVDWDGRGTVTGANMFTRQLGQTMGAAIFGTVANAALTRWLERAPASEANRVPRTVNTASRFLGANGSHLDTATRHYVRHGLYLAVHHVFLGLIFVSAFAVVVVLLTPRRFEKLLF